MKWAAWIALALLPSCQLDRLLRVAPFGAVEADPDRVNVWPIYYRNNDQVAVMWPVFDTDEKGFALRPVVSKNDSQWGILMPLVEWNTETGAWRAILAYSGEESFGLVPLFGRGEDWTHVGPVWWSRDEDGEPSSTGFFPLYGFGDTWGFVFPFAGWFGTEEGEGMVVTPLGGHGWDADGETTFWNVLGPVYHYESEGETVSRAVLWPLYRSTEGPYVSEWGLFPFHERSELRDEEGETIRIENKSLGGLVATGGVDELEFMRVLGLFSWRSEAGGASSLLDAVTLFGYEDGGEEGRTTMHVGTPLLFRYRTKGERYGWSSLLGTIRYDADEADSEFSFLYYLYRQRTKDGVTQRDLFPFISWDSGEDHSRFSFLWRLFDWETNGDDHSGHILFIPWD